MLNRIDKKSLLFKFLTMLVAIPFWSVAFQLDWKGYYLAQEIYVYESYQTSNKHLLEGEHWLSLQSTALISDGLSFVTQFELASADSKNVAGLKGVRQKGILSFDSLKDTRLRVSHLYGSYTGDFFQMRFGRQPISFGTGMTYTDGSAYDDRYYTFRDAVSAEVRIGSIYLKPYVSFLFDEDGVQEVEGILHASYVQDQWRVEALYRKDDLNHFIKNDNQAVNLFAQYQWNDFSFLAEWGANGSFSQMKNPSSMGALVKLSWDTPFYSSVVQLEGGYVGSNYRLHPNYDPTLILWGYYFLKSGVERENHSSMITDCFLSAVSYSLPILQSYEISMQYSWFPERHELLFVAQYDSNRGLIWQNFLGVVSRDQLKEMPLVSAVTRLVVQF